MEFSLAKLARCFGGTRAVVSLILGADSAAPSTLRTCLVYSLLGFRACASYWDSWHPAFWLCRPEALSWDKARIPSSRSTAPLPRKITAKTPLFIAPVHGK